MDISEIEDLGKQACLDTRSFKTRVLQKVACILEESNSVSESAVRLSIQGACLDLILVLEESLSGCALNPCGSN